MTRIGCKRTLKFAAACGAFLCGLCLPAMAVGQTLPEGTGKVEFVHNCTACHRADMVTAARKTPEGWRKSVDEMAARGTDGSKEDLDKVVLYLVTYYSSDHPDSPVPLPPAPKNFAATDATKSTAGIVSVTGRSGWPAEIRCVTCVQSAGNGRFTLAHKAPEHKHTPAEGHPFHSLYGPKVSFSGP